MEKKIIRLSYEQWAEEFKPIKNHLDQDAGFDQTLFETYGKDLEFIRDQIGTNTIWTILDDMTIIEGYRIINRFGYFITEKPYTAGNYEILTLSEEEKELIENE